MINFISTFKNIWSNFLKTDNSKSPSSPLPINQLPSDLILEIFSCLNVKDLGASCRVNKEWKQLANTPSLWRKAIYQELTSSTKNRLHLLMQLRGEIGRIGIVNKPAKYNKFVN